MNKNHLKVKATDFQYPTDEEWRESEKQFPNLTNFGFEYKNETKLFLELKTPLPEIPREVNLYWWDISMTNKIGKLKLAYINLNTHFQRYTKEFEVTATDVNIHRLQFDFYLETFFYFLFSLGDTIFQIINLYFNLKIDEKDVNTFKLRDKLKIQKETSDLSKLIIKFATSIDPKDLRNSFTHRFPKNQKDYRMIYDESAMILYAGSGQETSSSDLIKEVNKSIKIMDKFIIDLKSYLI